MSYFYYWSKDESQHSFRSLKQIKKTYRINVAEQSSGNVDWVNNSVKAYKKGTRAGYIEREQTVTE